MADQLSDSEKKACLIEDAEANRKAKARDIDEMIADEIAKAQTEMDAKVKSAQGKAALK